MFIERLELIYLPDYKTCKYKYFAQPPEVPWSLNQVKCDTERQHPDAYL
jgi:hypothetical protein